MKIVTVMNYPDRKEENIMCAAWIQQVKKYFPKDSDVQIFTEGKESEFIRNFANKNNVKIRHGKRSKQVSFTGHPNAIKAGHNVCFKLFNLCQIKEPFIFIDADAFILNSGKTLINAARDKGFIAINHQSIPGQTEHLLEPVLNSGVMIVSDPELFNWKNFISILLRDKGFRHPGTDQSLINSYFKELKYDYTHKDIGYEWNSWSKYTVWENNQAFCKGLSIEHPVYINHYWNDKKPWNVFCPIYNTLKNKLEQNNEI